jgi:DNA-binding response OmpR family regulator
VDDDELLCDALRELLRDDYAVASAPHGAAALELVKTHQPALILLDLRMPIMDGWSFVQQYRRSAVVPAMIVVMSAAADVKDVTTQLGADGHLQKPFDLQAVDELIAALLERGPSAAPGPA